jgi:hypothetical protein
MRVTNQSQRVGMFLLWTWCAPALAMAQQIKPMTLSQMERLFVAGVGVPQILQTAREGCIDFRIDGEAETRLNKAGATPTFITSLRTVCNGASGSVAAPGERQPQPSATVIPMSLAQMERLFSAGVDDSQILLTAREGCIDFRVDDKARERLNKAGATPTFLTSLRDICHRRSR